MAEGEASYRFVTEHGESKSSRNFTGRATAYYENGDIYDGEYVEGIRNGKGIYRYGQSKHMYEGGWEDNMRSGIGKMQYFGVGDYQGYWENNRMHGEGQFTYKNGDVYSGWYKYGVKEGYGTYSFKETGMKMTGEWKNGQIVTG